MRTLAIFLAGLAALANLSGADNRKAAPPTLRVPLGLLPIAWPADNPYSPEKVELGRLLFFDPRLSKDDSISCASCHSPEHAFTDGQPNSKGMGGQRGNRSAPTTLNRAYSLAQFWDGRAASLEDQAKGPMANPIEMAHTHDGVVSKLNMIVGYRARFEKVFGSPEVNIDQVAQAIATFERTLLSGNSPYDRYKAGQKTALTPSQIRGLDIFVNKAKCDQCHEGINFTSNSYHNLGVGMDRPNPDPGRSEVTKDPRDLGAFKTPTLRDIARTAPYMHDGSIKTLEEVVEFYDKGGTPNPNLDPKMKPLKLTEQDKKDLVAFLKALNGEGWQTVTAPRSFP
ncbi:MAG TPA: cytochrome-c peroxidase [Bryobacteraceae bacterium]|nr:cytochrome-c peroxidase [Bryobacteraceae bacterium]